MVSGFALEAIGRDIASLLELAIGDEQHSLRGLKIETLVVYLDDVQLLPKICVAQFVKQPNHEAKLKEFGEVSSWTRGEFIEKGGWDKMPGQEKADSEVARACAEGLGLLVKK